MRALGTILASVLIALLAGCTLLCHGIFISTLPEDVILEVRQLVLTGGGGKFEVPERYVLRAGRTKRAVCIVAEVTAMDLSRKVLFRQVLPSCTLSGDKYHKPEERKIYYLVTREGAYAIPVEWRADWKAHAQEIIAGFDLKAARQRLVKEGLLKE